MRHFWPVFVLALASSCSSLPPGAAVTSFEVNRYLGTWYEIARFDFTFEKDLKNTTATYTLNNNGTIRVENRGYNVKTNKWDDAVGTAIFAGPHDVGALRVSFFGPFYAGYNVIQLDKDYRYALVAGSSRRYLWILSREKTIPDAVKQQYLDEARRLGFKVENLVWVEQD